MTLHEIAEDFAWIDVLLDESGGELTPEIEGWLDELKADLIEKASGYGRYILNLRAESEACRREAQRLGDRARACERKEKWLAERMIGFMQSRDMDWILTPLHTLRITRNGGTPPLIIEDQSRLPRCYTKVVRVIDEEKIRRRLLAGGKVRGARMGERGVHLRVK